MPVQLAPTPGTADFRQQRAEFGGDARSGLLLKDAGLYDIFQQGSVGDTDWTKAFWRHLRRSLQDQLPSVREAVVHDRIAQAPRRSSRTCGAERLQFDLDFADVGNGRIGAIERPIGGGRGRPGERGNADDYRGGKLS